MHKMHKMHLIKLSPSYNGLVSKFKITLTTKLKALSYLLIKL